MDEKDKVYVVLKIRLHTAKGAEFDTFRQVYVASNIRQHTARASSIVDYFLKSHTDEKF